MPDMPSPEAPQAQPNALDRVLPSSEPQRGIVGERFFGINGNPLVSPETTIARMEHDSLAYGKVNVSKEPSSLTTQVNTRVNLSPEPEGANQVVARIASTPDAELDRIAGQVDQENAAIARAQGEREEMKGRPLQKGAETNTQHSPSFGQWLRERFIPKPLTPATVRVEDSNAQGRTADEDHLDKRVSRMARGVAVPRRGLRLRHIPRPHLPRWLNRRFAAATLVGAAVLGTGGYLVATQSHGADGQPLPSSTAPAAGTPSPEPSAKETPKASTKPSASATAKATPWPTGTPYGIETPPPSVIPTGTPEPPPPPPTASPTVEPSATPKTNEWPTDADKALEEFMSGKLQVDQGKWFVGGALGTNGNKNDTLYQYQGGLIGTRVMENSNGKKIVLLQFAFYSDFYGKGTPKPYAGIVQLGSDISDKYILFSYTIGQSLNLQHDPVVLSEDMFSVQDVYGFIENRAGDVFGVRVTNHPEDLATFMNNRLPINRDFYSYLRDQSWGQNPQSIPYGVSEGTRIIKLSDITPEDLSKLPGTEWMLAQPLPQN